MKYRHIFPKVYVQLLTLDNNFPFVPYIYLPQKQAPVQNSDQPNKCLSKNKIEL